LRGGTAGVGITVTPQGVTGTTLREQLLDDLAAIDDLDRRVAGVRLRTPVPE
jgi:hypothetical protein